MSARTSHWTHDKRRKRRLCLRWVKNRINTEERQKVVKTRRKILKYCFENRATCMRCNEENVGNGLTLSGTGLYDEGLIEADRAYVDIWGSDGTR
ncbi:hypothetical protein Y032_0691g1572 [Ancylostoma ceylanicum]|uniref:Uncharacterized protein n=1 Tax=Ancylostoma ceylanicum TaxID=53326 RepID=A0A016WHS5_9BILA|nr:hypothetical protein Y032_0691g1572 [Ancylostoma ceylanicum]